MLTLLKEHIIVKGDKTFINKNTIKTDSKLNFEFHPVALEIFEKYGSLYQPSQKFNDNLKIVMKDFYHWYKPYFEKEFKTPYDFFETKESRHGKQKLGDVKRLFKWDMITSHYGRGTFITILSQSEKVSFKQIQESAGQANALTTVGYMRPNSWVSPEEIIPITKVG
jgi:hypothetical protein